MELSNLHIPESSGATVAVIGGGYGGIAVARALDDVADVVLVEPKDAFVHNVAALRALVAPDWVERIFFPYGGLLTRGRVVRDRAVAIEPHRVALASGGEVSADYIVLATGSGYPFPAKSDADDTAEARERYERAHEALVGADRALVLGAGPAGLELAGEIKAAFPDKQVTIADIAPDILAGPFSPELRTELRRQLAELGIELLLATAFRDPPPTAAATLGGFTVTTVAGATLTADVWYRCYGVAPVTDYLTGELARGRRPNGHLEVSEHLRLSGQDTVFAIGDIVTADAQMASRAVREAALVAENIAALIAGDSELRAYQPAPPSIFVPLGPEGGAAQRPDTEIAGPEVVSQIKGAHMMIDRYSEMFGLAGRPAD